MSKELPSPLNTNERYLHGINIRLEFLIEQVGSLLEMLASERSVAQETVTYEEVVVPKEEAKPNRRKKAGA